LLIGVAVEKLTLSKFGSGAVSRTQALAVLLKYEHFLAMQERIKDEE
jgi:hypothetical protein